MKTATAAILFCTLLLGVIADHYKRSATAEQRARKCIEKSEYTDGDICHCLHINGLEDELCK